MTDDFDHSTLTAQEKQIVALIVQGYTNREIAAKLGRAEQSIMRDLRNVYDKVGVSCRLDLALLVLKHPLDRDH